MQRIHLDFVNSRRPSRWSDWSILLLGLASLVALVTWDQLYWQPLAAASETRLHTYQAAIAKRQGIAIPKIEDAQLIGEWSRAIRVANELNLPWDRLFTTFEAEANRPVAVLSLEPDAVKHECVITGEAKNFEEMLAYYRLLQQKEIFSDLALHTHQINRQDRENPIRFRITAKWMDKS